jgi:O-antigen/teichoic acid export membrane protein
MIRLVSCLSLLSLVSLTMLLIATFMIFVGSVDRHDPLTWILYFVLTLLAIIFSLFARNRALQSPDEWPADNHNQEPENHDSTKDVS